MNSRLIILLITSITISLYFLSCSKEKDSSSNEGIIIGLKENVNVTVLDTVIAGDVNILKSCEIDVNGDHIPDFRITSNLNTDYRPEVRVICLNSNALLHGFLINDTTFYYYHAEIYHEDTAPHVRIFSNTTYSCRRTDHTDTPVKIVPEAFKIAIKNKGEGIYKTDVYKSDSVLLSESWDTNNIDPVNHGDTIFYNLEMYEFNCNVFPFDAVKYIGIKYKDKQGDKIGWIKMSMTDGYKMTIFEFALQK